MRVVADSHAIVWYVQGSPRLSEGARSALVESEQNDGIVVSVATLVDLWYVTQSVRAPQDTPEELVTVVDDVVVRHLTGVPQVKPIGEERPSGEEHSQSARGSLIAAISSHVIPPTSATPTPRRSHRRHGSPVPTRRGRRRNRALPGTQNEELLVVREVAPRGGLDLGHKGALIRMDPEDLPTSVAR